jgi:hypothetical protein
MQTLWSTVVRRWPKEKQPSSPVLIELIRVACGLGLLRGDDPLAGAVLRLASRQALVAAAALARCSISSVLIFRSALTCCTDGRAPTSFW